MPSLANEDAHLILTKHLGAPGFELLAVEQRSGLDISTGLLSSTGRVTIVYSVEGDRRELDLFVKGLPEEELQRRDVLALGGCHKEALIYDRFLGVVGQAGGAESFSPRCYLARSNDVVVMEDLSCEGYKTLPLLQDYDVEHCKKTIDSIAKLHASSLIYERKIKKKLNEYIPEINEENIFSTKEEHVGRKRFFVGIKALRHVTNIYLSHYSKETVDKAFKIMESLPEKLVHSLVYPNVLTHSDLWNNNILFKYDLEGRVKNARLVDFQLCTYRPPSFDLQLFLYCCTGRKFRSQHYPMLLEYYYNQLKDNLQNEGLDLKSILTWESFKTMCQENVPIAVVMAPQFMHFVGMPDEQIKPILSSGDLWFEFYQINRNGVVQEAMEKSDAYRNKVVEGLTDLFEYCEAL